MGRVTLDLGWGLGTPGLRLVGGPLLCLAWFWPEVLCLSRGAWLSWCAVERALGWPWARGAAGAAGSLFSVPAGASWRSAAWCPWGPSTWSSGTQRCPRCRWWRWARTVAPTTRTMCSSSTLAPRRPLPRARPRVSTRQPAARLWALSGNLAERPLPVCSPTLPTDAHPQDCLRLHIPRSHAPPTPWPLPAPPLHPPACVCPYEHAPSLEVRKRHPHRYLATLPASYGTSSPCLSLPLHAGRAQVTLTRAPTFSGTRLRLSGSHYLGPRWRMQSGAR